MIVTVFPAGTVPAELVASNAAAAEFKLWPFGTIQKLTREAVPGFLPRLISETWAVTDSPLAMLNLLNFSWLMERSEVGPATAPSRSPSIAVNRARASADIPANRLVSINPP
jgi:hypothetical protein